jgi:hypothetical protein
MTEINPSLDDINDFFKLLGDFASDKSFAEFILLVINPIGRPEVLHTIRTPDYKLDFSWELQQNERATIDFLLKAKSFIVDHMVMLDVIIPYPDGTEASYIQKTEGSGDEFQGRAKTSYSIQTCLK